MPEEEKTDKKSIDPSKKEDEKAKDNEDVEKEKVSEKKETGEEKEAEQEVEQKREEREETEEEEEEEEEEKEELEEEGESEIEIAKSIRTGSSLLSPEGVVFLPIAILLDLIGIILICFGLDDLGITDIIGIATIGMWVFYKTGITPSAPQGTGQKAEDITKKAGEVAETAEKISAKAGKYGRWLRPALCILGEIIVWVGAIPFWSYLVYTTLRDNA